MLSRQGRDERHALAGLAKDADDLSLLSKMSDQERERLHRKGIFTVTQLSHTFRHRRNRKKLTHDHALKALAIRKNQVHVVGKVSLLDLARPVYIKMSKEIRIAIFTTA